VKPLKTKERSSPPLNRAKTEAEELDALNAEMRNNPARLMEASIEAKAKKRRQQERDASAAGKRSS
jgi:hypothetical protein